VADGPHGIDGITRWMGLRWDSAQTVRLALRPELLNSAGRLSGVVAYTLVDYSMGSTLWVETTDEESIATLSITVTYLRTATEGEIVCNSRLDRRTRSNAALRSEVLDDQGQVIATAVGTYAIFPRRR
jgi:acyl-CoA thioesterase